VTKNISLKSERCRVSTQTKHAGATFRLATYELERTGQWVRNQATTLLFLLVKATTTYKVKSESADSMEIWRKYIVWSVNYGTTERTGSYVYG